MSFRGKQTKEGGAIAPAAGQQCTKSAGGVANERRDHAVRSMLTTLLAATWLQFRGVPAGRERTERGRLKTAVMAALAHVDYYEDRISGQAVAPNAAGARSVGLSYREIKQRVESEHPGNRVSMMTIRSYARDAKHNGRTMPGRRPYSRRFGKTRPPSTVLFPE